MINNNSISDIAIVGGGAAGLMTAALFLDKGHITIFEKNEKLGKKLYITGKGRCNVTNASDMEEVMNHIVTNSRFLYSAFNKYNNYDVYDFFESHGVPLKIERGMRVFPESDKSSDIIKALTQACEKPNVSIKLRTKVSAIKAPKEPGEPFCLVVNGEEQYFRKVVIATGGLSYPTTGSTGDGYMFAKGMGHTVTKCYPSLVAFVTKDNFCKEMAGLSLKNVTATITKDGKELYSEFGEMLFTHTGVSGPIILSASAVCGIKAEGAELKLDLKPALSAEKLEERLIRDFTEDKNKQLKSVLRGLLPASMVPVFIAQAGLNGEKQSNAITKEERSKIIETMKGFTLMIDRLAGYNEAIITKGGINVKEVNPSTMESKLVKGLYFIGEVLDLDATTGGYNLQIAWSTAAACARALIESE